MTNGENGKGLDPTHDGGTAGAEAGVMCADDRIASLAPASSPCGRLRVLLPVAALSGALHLFLFCVFFFLSQAPSPAADPLENAVEVVQEPAPGGDAKKAEDVTATSDSGKSEEGSKSSEAKEDSRKGEEGGSQTKAPDERIEPVAKIMPPTTSPPVAQQEARRDPPEQKTRQSAEPSNIPSTEDLAKLQSLQEELASLQAQRSELQSQADAAAKEEAQARSRAAADQTKALGLLPESFSAVAVPSLSPSGEDPVTYEQAVYTLVNKAKRSGQTYMAGVAHVVFDIDARGGLTRVVIDHSSGNASVDAEALALIRRAAPFPPSPNGMPHSFPAYMSFVADH